MKKAVLIILPLFLGLFVSTSFAGEVTLFGPKEFLRTTGKPNVYTDTFSAAPLEGKLSIKNGDEDGGHRISSALISVNGEQVFRPNDFNQQFYRLEAPVNLAEDNSITVELRSKPGSYLTVQVTRKEESPTVTLTADPQTIHIGESSTLTWTTTHADSAIGSVSTQPGTFDLPLDGSISVWPTETTTYTITAKGPGGTATASVTVTMIPICISIASPHDGDTISRPDIMVEGAITNATGNETGVTVNGIVAIVYGDQFVANHVSLQEGGNTITATATDTAGNTATTSRNINALTTGDYIRITGDTESGISPLETTLRIEGSFSFAQEPTLTYDGPDAVEFLDSPNENEYNVRITKEGIYFLTAAVDYQGSDYKDTIAIVVLNQAELDALLTAKWDGMKTSLINNNIEGALNYFHESSKQDYHEIFNLLRARLPHIVSAMREIELIYSEDRLAKYRIRREEVVQGQTYDITYYIYFIRDFNGLWRIDTF